MFNTRKPLTGLVTEWTSAFFTDLIVGRHYGLTVSIISDTVDRRHVILNLPKEYYYFYMTPWLMILVPIDPSKPFNLYPDWRMIWTYGHTPPSFPCPKAWKDPAADYVWWLA